MFKETEWASFLLFEFRWRGSRFWRVLNVFQIASGYRFALVKVKLTASSRWAQSRYCWKSNLFCMMLGWSCTIILILLWLTWVFFKFIDKSVSDYILLVCCCEVESMCQFINWRIWVRQLIISGAIVSILDFAESFQIDCRFISSLRPLFVHC